MYDNERQLKVVFLVGLLLIFGVMVWGMMDESKYDAQCRKQGGTPYHTRYERYCLPVSESHFGIRVKGFDE